jgi:membrane protein implicated in regulation of membrane protease activity
VVPCLCSLSLSLSTLWFVVVFTLVVFLWIPYQDLAEKEEKTHNEEAAPEEEPRDGTSTVPHNYQGADTLNVDGGDRNNGVGQENDRGANIRQVNSGAVIGLVLCVARALVAVSMLAWRHSQEHLADKENK